MFAPQPRVVIIIGYEGDADFASTDARQQVAPAWAAAGGARCLTRLLQESAAGGELAFAELYERTQAQIHRVVLGPLRSVDHAREVVQETYLEVWLHADRFDPAKGSAISWLSMIAYRRAVDRIRFVEASRARDTGHANLDAMTQLFDFGDEIAAKVDARFVRTALISLSPIQRQAVVMKYVEGHTLKHMAVLLALPLGTVKTRVRDGLIAIRLFIRNMDLAPSEPDR